MNDVLTKILDAIIVGYVACFWLLIVSYFEGIILEGIQIYFVCSTIASMAIAIHNLYLNQTFILKKPLH